MKEYRIDEEFRDFERTLLLSYEEADKMRFTRTSKLHISPTSEPSEPIQALLKALGLVKAD